MFVKLKTMSSTIKWSNCLLAIGATLLLVAVSLPEARGLSSVDGRGMCFNQYLITLIFKLMLEKTNL